MAPRLPPDLVRVGDDLVAAAERTLQARRARRRMLARTAATSLAALAALTALVPAALGPATRGANAGLVVVQLEPPGLPAACDQPRGGRLLLPACAAGEPIRLGRPRRW
jgi:hypothetical protein